MLIAAIVLAATAAGRCGGIAAAPFLRQEPTARVTAMGGASAALYDEAGALYRNPAGLGFAPGHHLGFSAWSGVDGKSREAFLSGVYDAGALGGFSLSYLRHASGKEDLYDIGGNLSSVELASEYAFGLGWGHSFGRNLAAGAQAKFVRSELAEAYSDKTRTLDAGVLLRTNSGRFSLGAGVQNATGELKYVNEADPLPRVTYWGAALRLPSGGGKQLLLAADLRRQKGESSGDTGLGLEYAMNRLAVRLGVRRAGGQSAMTAGGGVRFKRFGFDYGFQAAGDLDQPVHKFAFNMFFGSPSLRSTPSPL